MAPKKLVIVYDNQTKNEGLQLGSLLMKKQDLQEEGKLPQIDGKLEKFVIQYVEVKLQGKGVYTRFKLMEEVNTIHGKLAVIYFGFGSDKVLGEICEFLSIDADFPSIFIFSREPTFKMNNRVWLLSNYNPAVNAQAVYKLLSNFAQKTLKSAEKTEKVATHHKDTDELCSTSPS